MNGLGYVGIYPTNVPMKVYGFFATAAGPLIVALGATAITLYDPADAPVAGWNPGAFTVAVGTGWYYKPFTPTIEGIYVYEYQIAGSSLYYGAMFRSKDVGVAI